MCILCQHRTSKRTEEFTMLNGVYNVLTIRDGGIKQNRTVSQSTRTTLRTTLEDGYNVSITD